jgi:enoyl-CoA hydratase/carnithine racemase
MNKQLWTEIGAAFDALADDCDCRAIVLSGAGVAFCAGIDFKEMVSVGGGDQELDVSRKAWKLRSTIEQFQRCMSSAEKVRPRPLCPAHKPCISSVRNQLSPPFTARALVPAST